MTRMGGQRGGWRRNGCGVSLLGSADFYRIDWPMPTSAKWEILPVAPTMRRLVEEQR